MYLSLQFLFLFTAPQLLSRERHRNNLPHTVLRVTIQAVRDMENRSPPLLAKSTGKGLGAVMTTGHTTHRLVLHGNSVDKDA